MDRPGPASYLLLPGEEPGQISLGSACPSDQGEVGPDDKIWGPSVDVLIFFSTLKSDEREAVWGMKSLNTDIKRKNSSLY